MDMDRSENAEKTMGHTVDFERLKEELMLFIRGSAEGEFSIYPLGDNRHENCLSFIFCNYGVPEGATNREILLDGAIESLEADIARRTEFLDILKKHAAGDA